MKAPVPDDMPITQYLTETVAQLSEEYRGDVGATTGKTLAALINAVGALERRVADIEAVVVE